VADYNAQPHNLRDFLNVSFEKYVHLIKSSEIRRWLNVHCFSNYTVLLCTETETPAAMCPDVGGRGDCMKFWQNPNRRCCVGSIKLVHILQLLLQMYVN